MSLQIINDKLILLEVPEGAFNFTFDTHRKIISAFEPSDYDSDIDWFSEKLPDNCKILGKLSEISEEDCAKFVNTFDKPRPNKPQLDYIDYTGKAWFDTAKESLISLLESHEIDINKSLLLIEKI